MGGGKGPRSFLPKLCEQDVLFERLERKMKWARHLWLTPVILVTWEAEIRGIMLGDQPGQIILKTPSQKQPEQNGLEAWLKW
jgi:hypothetical protein